MGAEPRVAGRASRVPSLLLGAALGGLPALLAPAAAGATDAARGAALAEERQCGACHGAAGISATEGIPSLAGQQPGFVALQLVLFREGLRDVPLMAGPSEGLEDSQVEDLAAHFAALPPGAPPDRRPRDAALDVRGAELAGTMRCGVCHLPAYAGQNQVPRLVAQREEFLAATLRAYRDDVRRGSDTQMNAAVHGASDAQLDALAHHLSQR